MAYARRQKTGISDTGRLGESPIGGDVSDRCTGHRSHVKETDHRLLWCSRERALRHVWPECDGLTETPDTPCRPQATSRPAVFSGNARNIFRYAVSTHPVRRGRVYEDAEPPPSISGTPQRRRWEEPGCPTIKAMGQTCWLR